MSDRPLVDDIGLDDLRAVLRVDTPETARRSRTLPGIELYHPGEREAWADYLKRHGAQPDEVAIPGLIVTDDAARTIGWLTYERDTAGHILYDWHAGDGVRARYLMRTVQLEAPALPFPDEAPDWPWP